MNENSPILSLICAIDSLAEELRLINSTLKEIIDREKEEEEEEDEQS